MDKKEKFGLGHILASIFVAICFTCVSAVIVALTLKLIYWLY